MYFGWCILSLVAKQETDRRKDTEMNKVFLVKDTYENILGVYKTEHSAMAAAEVAKGKDHEIAWKTIYRGCWGMWIETANGLEAAGLIVDTHELN